MKIPQYLSSAVIFLLGSLMANAEIVTTFTLGANASTNDLTRTIEAFAVEAGDVVVFAGATNKKISAADVSFSSSASDVITKLDTASVIGGEADPNPTGHIGYMTITQSGSYDFTITVSAANTTNWGIYLLRSSSGGTIAFLDSAAYSTGNIKENADVAISYDWGGTAYDQVAVIEVGGTVKGTIAPDYTAGNLLSLDIDLGTSTRIAGSGTNTNGISSLTSNYDFVYTDTEDKIGQANIVGVAFAETGGGSTEPNVWMGYDIDNDNFVETGGWLGTVDVILSPWVYSEKAGKWMYAPEDQSGDGGGWFYIDRSSN